MKHKVITVVILLLIGFELGWFSHKLGPPESVGSVPSWEDIGEQTWDGGQPEPEVGSNAGFGRSRF